MSAFSHTDWTVNCDFQDAGGGCLAQLRSDMLPLAAGGRGETATEIRRILRASGWTVDVKTWNGVPQKRHLDFCPAHKPPKANTK